MIMWIFFFFFWILNSLHGYYFSPFSFFFFLFFVFCTQIKLQSTIHFSCSLYDIYSVYIVICSLPPNFTSLATLAVKADKNILMSFMTCAEQFYALLQRRTAYRCSNPRLTGLWVETSI